MIIGSLVYNNPATRDADISPDLFARLSKIGNLRYVKEAPGDVMGIVVVRRRSSDDLTLSVGADHIMFESSLMGTEGGVAGACLIPELCVRLQDLVRDGRLDEVRAL